MNNTTSHNSANSANTTISSMGTSSMGPQTILVTGATGNVASHVLPQLMQKGAKVRVLLRSDAKAQHFQSMGCEVVIGDFSNKASLKTALTGVNSVLLVTPAGAESHKHVESFLDVAKDFTVEDRNFKHLQR